MPEFIVTGAGGMLARSWAHRLTTEGIGYEALSRPDLDITNPAAVAATIGPSTEWVVNCAAWTDVDRAESEFEAANTVNADGVRVLAERCAAVGAKLVHYSTDYVFDGQAGSPYQTDHPRAPINAYGRSKASGEEFIEKAGVGHLLIRSSWLYAPWGKNFVLTMRDLVRSRPTLRVVDDQRGRPSSCENIADATLGLIRHGVLGTFHVCDGGECTWFELASKIRDVVNPSCVIEPCTTAEFPRPAARPAFSVLDMSQTESVLGPMADWRDRVEALLTEEG
ncbi:MAG: dTDP-4-dehydrorhamnose reductase [Polyangiales bacterium]